ncbi:endonuclease/exonuclease/phosphatase family protein [Treponema sp. OMZ 840]|uniref:endonuclease/exonuclease/phosphatase family protein n=1 Tax=Treponema sp. OMZ 840 TaxID=244313 RepID=UPI003D8B4FBD
MNNTLIQKIGLLSCLFFLFFDVSACRTEKRPVRIISWNVQTFFDAHTAGTEYAEFGDKSGLWSIGKYEARLKRLCAFMRENPADIYVFEEIENRAVLQDIANYNAGFSGAAQKTVTALFAGEKNGSLGIAVISRLPIKKAAVHQIHVQALIRPDKKETGKMRQLKAPPLRPLLEIHFENKDDTFILFACHWKSKSGGAQKSDIWRELQEKLLVQSIAALTEAEKEKALIVCGDFNRALEEFSLCPKDSDKKNTVALTGASDTLKLYSAWLTFQSAGKIMVPEKKFEKERGSYYFKGRWEKIDHFFYNGQVQAKNFFPLDFGAHTDKGGLPLRYNIHTGAGYSDHLPLVFDFI